MPQPDTASKANTALVANNIHKSFGSLEVLKGLLLEAHEGDVFPNLASSGSCKSTFLRCIKMLEVPDQGRIAAGSRREIIIR